MTIRYIDSNDKYVQYRYMGTDITGTPNPFLNTANWQSVDKKPRPNSQNFIESGGVDNIIKNITSLTQETELFLSSKNGIKLGNLNVGDVCTFEYDNSNYFKSLVFTALYNGIVVLQNIQGGSDDKAYAILDDENKVLILSASAINYNGVLKIQSGQTIVINSISNGNESIVYKKDNTVNDKINTLGKSIQTDIQETGKLIHLTNVATNIPSTITGGTNIVVIGRNQLDGDSLQFHKIKNNSGVEITDSQSSYFSYYIPVIPGLKCVADFLIEKYYKFSKNKTFISRTSTAIAANTSFIIPNDTYWIQVQINSYKTNYMLVLGEIAGSYEPFKSNNQEELYSESVIYNETRDELTISCCVFAEITNELENSKKTYPNSSVVYNLSRQIESLRVDENTYNVPFDTPLVLLNKNVVLKTNNITTDETTVNIIGENILDGSTFKFHKIKNNSGVEVDDTSSYYTHYIPCHGCIIQSSFVMQRVYLFDENKNFISRTDISTVRKTFVVPSNTWFIQIQTTEEIRPTNPMVVINGIGDLSIYKPYSLTHSLENIESACCIYSDGVTNFEMILNITCKGYIPAVESYAVWEPEEATDDFSCPIGQGTQSVEGLTYQGFLTSYFDNYIYRDYGDGYSVTKEALGCDSGNNATDKLGNELYSYVFSPKNYNKTVLLSAGMNACELSGFFGIAYFIKALMEHTEDGMLALYNSTRFVIVPVMCPSSLNSSPIKYFNYNGVRINKNWNYNNSWQTIGEYRGAYPDSEVETQIMKRWINKYNGANLWIDCHSDAGQTGYTNMLTQTICSDANTMNIISSTYSSLASFYRNKGYIPSGTNPTMQAWVDSGGYPKTGYSKAICNVPAIMIEQYISSLMYGSDGATNNDSYGIKNYTTMLRTYILAVCKSPIEIIL